MKRKIAAILAADIAGYSKLVAEDEEETVRRLAAYRAVFDDFIARFGGRVFNTAGDAVMAEFPSAVDAVRCAVDVQESLRTRNLAYAERALELSPKEPTALNTRGLILLKLGRKQEASEDFRKSGLPAPSTGGSSGGPRDAALDCRRYLPSVGMLVGVACGESPKSSDAREAKAAVPAERPSEIEQQAKPDAGAPNGNTLAIKLDSGTVSISLRPDLAPKHVEPIEQLAKEGFYDGVKFHRVIPGFMAQTGDPTGTGQGGSKYPNLPAELSQQAFRRGTVGAARTDDPDSANSQFFICLSDTGCSALTGRYTVLGRVEEGMGLVDKIAVGEPPDKPTVMRKVSIGTPHQE